MLGFTFVVLLISTPLPSPEAAHAPATVAGRPLPRAPGTARRPSRDAAAEGADELYARRARRRMAAYLRLRLLEMREAGLARAAEVVERRLVPLATDPDADGR